jgi:hypothetical protein
LNLNSLSDLVGNLNRLLKSFYCEQWPPIAHNRWCLGLARSVTCLCWAYIGFIRGNRAFCLISYEIFGWLHTPSLITCFGLVVYEYVSHHPCGAQLFFRLN